MEQISANKRGLPDDVVHPPRLARGESVARQNGNLIATVWQDKKQVHVVIFLILLFEVAVNMYVNIGF